MDVQRKSPFCAIFDVISAHASDTNGGTEKGGVNGISRGWNLWRNRQGREFG